MATTTRRAWLRPPQLRTLDDQGERHATWLELFFDLVFVISIAEVVHTLEDYHTLGDFLGSLQDQLRELSGAIRDQYQQQPPTQQPLFRPSGFGGVR